MYTYLFFKYQDEIQCFKIRLKANVSTSLNFIGQKDFHAAILYLAKLSTICKDKSVGSFKHATSQLLYLFNTSEEAIICF